MAINRKQIHRIELVVELDNECVGDVVDKFYKENYTIIASDTTPLDIEEVENKWIKDILKERR